MTNLTLSPFMPVLTIPAAIIKRDGRTVAFDPTRIETAIAKCFSTVYHTSDPADLMAQVVNVVSAKYQTPTVEQVQDEVERALLGAGEYEAAKHYILYRAEHTKVRQERPIPPEVVEAFAESAKFFTTPIQQLQFYDKYSRFDYETGHRETWIETVHRTMNFLRELSQNKLEESVYTRLQDGILNMRAMPSMRLLAMAGPAARRSNIALYNCSYMPVDSLDAFVEALIISMNGCGVGYSVERGYVENLPRIKRQNPNQPEAICIVADTTEGWADALRLGLTKWFNGEDVRFNLDNLRPQGAPLKTKGGRASGPEPLRVLLAYARSLILSRQGGTLRTTDAHKLMCAVGSAAVSGGVRRTAMIALISADDQEMRQVKNGVDFSVPENQLLWNANNSAVWPVSGLTDLEIMRQMLEMFEGERGEPGIFSREAALTTKPSRREEALFGTNPCGEIVLRPMQFCNLSIAVARADDNLITLTEKVKLATIIGTIQSMGTNFPGLRPQWAANCEEERLLGVDINGQLDCPLLREPGVFDHLKIIAQRTNAKYADLLGINRSTAITTVKPSGNSSQLLNCSSGMHPRWSLFYERNIRITNNSPIHKVLRDAGVPMSPENGQTAENAATWVVHFPVKAPDGAITRKDRTALEQCEYWLYVKEHWTEHNPSITITYQPHEVMDVLAWVVKNKSKIGGMTFLPASDAKYDQAPYVEISAEEYAKRMAAFPAVDYSKLWRYEAEDLTTAAQELACLGAQCDIETVPLSAPTI